MRIRILLSLVLIAVGCGDDETYLMDSSSTDTSSAVESETAGDDPVADTSTAAATSETTAAPDTSTSGSSDGETSSSGDGTTTGTRLDTSGSTTGAPTSDETTTTSGEPTTSGETTTTSGEPTTSGETTSTSGGTTTTSGEGSTSSSNASSSDESSSDESSSDESSSEGESSSTGDGVPDPIYEEHFDGIDGSPWPAPWEAISDWVIESDLEGETGRLSGESGFVGRMALPGFAVVDVDVTFVVAFDDPEHQGAGLYVRQNGGVLTGTEPQGEGYEIYLEGDVVQTLAVWREVGGLEQHIASVMDPIAGGIQPGVRYALRFQCVQNGATTDLRVKAWPEDEAEPLDWMLEVSDPTPSLQNAAGSFAVDIYNYFDTNSVYFDDVVISAPL